MDNNHLAACHGSLHLRRWRDKIEQRLPITGWGKANQTQGQAAWQPRGVARGTYCAGAA